MKNLLSLIGLFVIIVSGCSQDDALNQFASSNSKKFTASFETNESRTYIEEGKWLRWTKGDQISLFEGNSLNSKYQFDGETGDNAGTFSKMKPSSPVFGTGTDLSSYYAVYPYASSMNITESGVITANLPAEQGYAEKSFGLGANTMVAVTQDTDDYFLKFKNVGGYLKVQLYGDDVTVKSITLKGNKDEKLAGKATITPAYGKDPQISMANDATTAITLNCGEGVKIGASAEAATAFWMVVPPTTFKSGFTITITDIEGNEFTKSTTNEILVKRNDIKPMAAFEVAMQSDNDIPYITFTADEEQTFTMTKAVSTLEYSVNNGAWKELGTSTITFGGNNGNLQLRGNNIGGTAGNYTDGSEDYSTIIFGYSDVEVSCKGDIRTLLDYENYSTTSTNKAMFIRLFENCTNLISAPDLPATILADYCYMQMFKGCTNLINAPELPASTLTKHCYDWMFGGCESLTTAPELKAKTLTEYCYRWMFSDCKKINHIIMLATDVSAFTCLHGFLDGVATTGTFIKSKELDVYNDMELSMNVVPRNWEVKDYEE